MTPACSLSPAGRRGGAPYPNCHSCLKYICESRREETAVCWAPNAGQRDKNFTSCCKFPFCKLLFNSFMSWGHASGSGCGLALNRILCGQEGEPFRGWRVGQRRGGRWGVGDGAAGVYLEPQKYSHIPSIAVPGPVRASTGQLQASPLCLCHANHW